ncbi:hypothetical protein [Corynebacterium uterequi]|uniref:Uncharacterized protein n=1 Tax=Corynebacterium uterequi TaxID=1072256 RepID=A0A0G3HBR1_9CORY|nr:hypothetical protein [Corynebacterium uterequi]AKK10110.1 hypothetical protein CUTER_00405 [Corynebacterium uterequi]
MMNREEFARKFGGMTHIIDALDIVGEDGSTAMTFLLGQDQVERLIQLPVSFHEEPPEEAALLAETTCGWAASAMHNPVAVAALIRTILGDREVGKVTIEDATRQRCVGYARIDGEETSFFLRVPNLPSRVRSAGVGHTTPKLRLMRGESVLANLTLHDALG